MQRRHISEVIRLHYAEGYGEDRIAKIIPIGHSTVSRWIAIFAKGKGKETMGINLYKVQDVNGEQLQLAEIRELHKKVKEQEKQLLEAEIKAEAYDELINMVETKFRIPIRKKLVPSSREPACKGLDTLSRRVPLCTVWRNQAGLLPI